MAFQEIKDKLGKPENLVCWLVGGHYGSPPAVWSISYNQNSLQKTVKLTHFENPVAKQQGVKILGITTQGPDDTAVEEEYELAYSQAEPVGFALYLCKQDVTVWDRWKLDQQKFLKEFIKEKGYDLTEEEANA
jgi:hypothetical protein